MRGDYERRPMTSLALRAYDRTLAGGRLGQPGGEKSSWAFRSRPHKH